MTRPAIERFAEKYEAVTETGCWLWTAACFAGREYGMFTMVRDPMGAHRASWLLHRGAIPGGVCVLHRCDTPSCVNPDHLFLGSIAENNQDRAQKGRSFRPRGTKKSTAKLTDERVAEIRALPQLTFVEAQRYADAWGVSPHHLYRVRNGSRWLDAA